MGNKISKINKGGSKFYIELVKLARAVCELFDGGSGTPPTGLSPVCAPSACEGSWSEWIKSILDSSDGFLPDF